ncbi:MAG: bifunctional DNA-formamidopyrimidine glycosylase/DNA-(apurinic or apyrimidinic site) lyase [Pyrinomonadaceae bacterium]
MPELPEVELVVRALDALISGRQIMSAELFRQRLAPEVTAADFAIMLSYASIRKIARRGKHILFDLDNDRTLIVHLRMSGRFLHLGPDDPNPKFTHAEFHFSDGSRLVFDDQRHFGLMKVVDTAALTGAKELSKLAPEPFSDEFSPESFFASLRSSRRPLKEFLLDQTKVCGLGNIYAAEAMFLAGIHPAKTASLLSRKRSDRLFQTIRDVLIEAIEAGSALNTDPQNSQIGYYSGEYESYWRVYGREDLPCLVCENPIMRFRQAGRSSFYCPSCQKK